MDVRSAARTGRGGGARLRPAGGAGEEGPGEAERRAGRRRPPDGEGRGHRLGSDWRRLLAMEKDARRRGVEGTWLSHTRAGGSWAAAVKSTPLRGLEGSK